MNASCAFGSLRLRPIELLVAAQRVVGETAFAEVGLHAPPGAGRCLDQDDLCAEVAEEHRAVGTGREAAEIEDANTFESHHGGGFSFFLISAIII